MKPVVACFAFEEYTEKLVREHPALAEDFDLRFFSVPVSGSDVPEDARDAQAIGVFVEGSTVTAETLDAMPDLKLVATFSTGYDHIDLEACRKKGVAVSNVPSYGEHTVAEFAFGLLLALFRKIAEGVDRAADRDAFSSTELRGHDLFDKTLGVVGTGRIGKNVVRIAKGFGMNVLAHDVYEDKAFEKETGFTYVSLDELLRKSDIVTFHVPNMKETRHMLNSSNIGLMKQGAYVINTARGEVVETAALFKALKSGALGGAGLDVCEEEDAMRKGGDSPVISMNKDLMAMPNVIMTPHNAFNTWEAIGRIVQTSAENIVQWNKGNPQNIVS